MKQKKKPNFKQWLERWSHILRMKRLLTILAIQRVSSTHNYNASGANTGYSREFESHRGQVEIFFFGMFCEVL
jgi:hypothetical protein